ncbi:hypothetical protein LNJ08_11895 [Tenacibaculum finnmarkense genomovar ulcerans]|uniref:hypothetical protein n=1 Tax=Tenacibaculum finnmarkense TaxID=2781243 RepID=UPI001E56E924|nr:hypothetical protein [Tenacibaculum finnmarkense]MCD8455093.1 hypothetical protein [Tenacibaculum finnmarkense genomovar ulcerans]
MIQNSILELQSLGKMPNEYMDDGEDVELLRKKYKECLASIKTPINFNEAKILITLFPDDIFYDLEYDIFSLIETFSSSNINQYEDVIKKCNNSSYKELLISRLERK